MGLLLIIVLLRIRLTWGSRNYKSVFTAHDVYRATYCPTTIPEEQFTDWDPENTPQCPPNLIPSVQAGSALVQEYKSNDSGHPTGSTEVVRCPYGWHPIGPFCSTLSLVQPYTQCPLDAHRFVAGPSNPVFPVPDQPEVCQRISSMGVSLRCPPTFSPVTPLESDTETTLECRRTQVFPFVFLRNTTTLGLPPSAATPDGTRVCPSGAVAAPEKGGCVATMRMPPEPSCPDGYELSSTIVDPYAFYGKQAVECRRDTFIKGKIWCPEGYEISGHAYPNVPFGGIIFPEETASEDSFPFTYTNQALLLLRSGWTDVAKFTFIENEVVCFQVLVTPATNCDDLECSSPFLTELRRVLINWSYRQLLTDPDYIVHLAIPSGRDFRVTPSGLRRQHR